jgi:putative transposase
VATKNVVRVAAVDVAASVERLPAMRPVLLSLLMTVRDATHSRARLQLELLALRHQLQVLQRTRPRRLPLTVPDRWLWVSLSRVWTDWRTALVIVRPETVIAWHRRSFRLFWTWKSRQRTNRPPVAKEARDLIRPMSQANPLWGASDPWRIAEGGH